MWDRRQIGVGINQGMLLAALLLAGSACTSNVGNAPQPAVNTDIQWHAYRFRDDFAAALNADGGWAAPENVPARLTYDKPFRLRVQVSALTSPPEGHVLGLQYRTPEGSWLPVGVAEFPYPQFASPLVSVITAEAYAAGAETERLLGDAVIDWDEGAGLSAAATTPVWRNSDAREWEWPLVIRRFSDGPTFADDELVFEMRVVDGSGQPVSKELVAQVSMSAAPGHLGGTFIETPARLGPYQSESGQMYFFMEPAETDNRFMAMHSMDGGRRWTEVDGAGRPRADDLEGVASVQSGDVIHIVHQVSEEVFYHAFEMDSQQLAEGRWRVNSQSIATMEEPPTQIVDVVARSDGSLVTLYGGDERLFLQSRSAAGEWGEPQELDITMPPQLSGPVLAVAPNDMITLAYTGRDGGGFVRHLLPDGTLTDRQQFSSSLGTSDAENGAIAPLAMDPLTGATVMLYREHDGFLYERRFSRIGELSLPVRVSELRVISDAVDSEQVGADLVADGAELHLLFIEETSRDIYYSYSVESGVWSRPVPIIEGVDASWIRGSIHRDAAGKKVYGFVYDAGSNGGSGYNRYFAIPLS